MHAFGTLTSSLLRAARPHVEGKFVWDLGCGNLALSVQLAATCKPSGVRGVDCKDVKATRLAELPGNVFYEQATFAELLQDPDCPETIDVAFVSWPFGGALQGLRLHTLLERAETVVYLGKNTGGTACGNKALWTHLLSREVLAHVASPRNCLTVYGAACDSRPITEEEYGAVNTDWVPYRWYDANKLSISSNDAMTFLAAPGDTRRQHTLLSYVNKLTKPLTQQHEPAAQQGA